MTVAHRTSDNNFDDFTRPDHYIRHIEPLEIDLARQVEYDMDEQGMVALPITRPPLIIWLADKEWMDAVNAERKKEQLNKVTYETFEVVMDRLEKEWFDLVRGPSSLRVFALIIPYSRQKTFQNQT